MIGPAAPAKRNFSPSDFQSVASPGLMCATRGVGVGFALLAEEEVEGEEEEVVEGEGVDEAVEREPAPTREEGTRAVCSRTLRTSSLCDVRSARSA